jgi:hypothetical protein
VNAWSQTSPYHYVIPADVATKLVYCLEQDNYGRLLIGTDQGLYRYNGFRSKQVKAVGAYTKEITQIIRFKNTFFMTNRAGQVLQYKNEQLAALKLPGLKGDIRSISIENGTLQVITVKEIYAYQLRTHVLLTRTQIPFAESKGILVNSCIQHNGSRFAVLNSGELVEVEEEEARYIPKGTGRQLVTFGNQLVAIPCYTANEHVFTYFKGQFKSKGTLLPRRNVRVSRAEVIQNQLFVFTDYGLVVYTNSISRKPALWFEGIAVTDIFQDAQRNLWIGTKGKGLLFVPAGKHEIVNPASFFSLAEGPKGTFFGGLVNGSISQFNRYGQEISVFVNAQANQEVQFLHFDELNQLLFSNYSIFGFKRIAPAVTSTEAITGVVRTNTGDWYIGKSTGLVKLAKSTTMRFFRDYNDSNRFQSLLTDPIVQLVKNSVTGQIVVATQRSLYLLGEDGKFKELTHAGKSIEVQQLCWFKSDLYVSTVNNKLILIRNGKVLKERSLTYSGAELLVQKMLASAGYIYFLTEKGMYRLPYIDHPFESLKDVIGFDGLSMRDFIVHDNVLHIATQKGVLRYTWDQKNHIALDLVMGKAYGKSKLQEEMNDSVMRFPAEERMIIIPFECVDLSGTHQFILQYRIQMEGEHGVWNNLPVSTEQINFSHLSAGTYAVEMRLLDPLSKAVTPVQKRYFLLEAAWYEYYSLWFVLGTFFATLGAILLRKWETTNRFERLT